MKTITKSQYLYLKSKKNAYLSKNETITIEDEEYEDLIQYSNKQITPINNDTIEPEPIEPTPGEEDPVDPQEETYDYSECDFGVEKWGYNIISLKDKTVSIKYCGNRDTLIEAIIPETVEYNNVLFSVTSISNNAFSNCKNLTSIDIPDNVTSIDSSAFFYCSSITSIDIPDNVTSIGANAFQGCNGLTSIDIPDSVTNIGYWAFRDCNSLTSIDIPDSVTNIGYWAFSGCSSLTSINIPDSVTSIGEGAFRDCTSLTSCTIGNNVISIGERAFSYCTSLTSITIYRTNINFININDLTIDHQIIIYVLPELVNDYKSYYEKDIFLGKVNILPIE